MKRSSISFIFLLLIFFSCNLFDTEPEEIEVITEDQIISISGVNFTEGMSIFDDIAAFSTYHGNKSYIYFYKKTSDNWEYTESLFISGGGIRGTNIGINDSLLVFGAVKSAGICRFEDDSWTVDTLFEFTNAEVGIYRNDIVISHGWYIDFFHYDGYNWVSEQFNSSITHFAQIKVKENIAFNEDNTFNQGRGIIRIFKKSDIWEVEDTLSAWDARAGDRFGYSIDISEDYLIAGALGDNSKDSLDTGSAYIFKLNNGEWVLDEKLFIENASPYLRFGSSVAITNSYAVIGAPYDNESGVMAGAAYLYENSSSGWKLIAKLMASDAETRDEFGSNVIISDNNDIMIATERDEKIYYFRP